MNVKEGFLLARGHIAFILGVLAAFGLIAHLEGWKFRDLIAGPSPEVVVAERPTLPDAVIQNDVVEPEPLDDELRQWAEVAWKYFERNTQESGLVNSVDGYPSTTMWDTASYLMGLLAAEKLEIIDGPEFEERMSKAIAALDEMPLIEGVPNKAYHTETLEMVDYTNAAVPGGIGWSAIDIARLLVPLQIVVWRHPEMTPEVQQLIESWNLATIIEDGTMFGAERSEATGIKRVQEGRLGYEEYAAKSFGLLGFDVSAAEQYDDFLEVVDVEGVPIATDSRDHETYHAHNYVVSEPFLLDAFEFGFDRHSRLLALNAYEAQKRRSERVGRPVAVTESHLDRPPHFVYNTIFANGKAWNAITDQNEDASAHRTLSTKAAMGWYVLFGEEYGEDLRDAVSELFDEEKGFYSGRYVVDGEINKALTANTNGIILESLAYRHAGPMLALTGSAPKTQVAQSSNTAP